MNQGTQAAGGVRHEKEDTRVIHAMGYPLWTPLAGPNMFGGGISREGSLLDVAVDYDVVRKSGAWYTYDGDQLGQGRENAKEFTTSYGNVSAASNMIAFLRKLVSLRPGDHVLFDGFGAGTYYDVLAVEMGS